MFRNAVFAQEATSAATPSAVRCINQNNEFVPCREGFAPLSELTVIFANVVGVILAFAGFAVLLMLIVGGFRYIVARGDPKAISQARGTITWAVVGLVFIIMAFLIVDFIAGFVEIPAVGTFCIPGPGRTCPYTL